MFTGIVEEIGVIRNMERSGNAMKIRVGAKKVLEDVQLGDSIATNGVCLTVTSFGEDFFTADVMVATMEKAGLNRLSIGSKVNLERALTLSSRLGGHILQGHVDCVGTIRSIEEQPSVYLLEVAMDPKFYPYVLDQGSIGLNGVSLTIYKAREDSVTVSLIPETLSRTNIMDLSVGDPITMEFDLLGKYVYKNLFGKKKATKEKRDITREFLLENGF